jgi:hypothetical protein
MKVPLTKDDYEATKEYLLRYNVRGGCYIKGKWFEWGSREDTQVLLDNPCDGDKIPEIACHLKNKYGYYQINCYDLIRRWKENYSMI